MTPLDKADLEVLFNKTFIPIRNSLVVGESLKDSEGRRWRFDAVEPDEEHKETMLYLLHHGEYYALIAVTPLADENIEVRYEIRLQGVEHVGDKKED